jgi:hypothetical protein
MSRQSGGGGGEWLGMRVPCPRIVDRQGRDRLKPTRITVACGPGTIRFKPTFFFYSNLLRFVKYKTQSSCAPKIFNLCMGLGLNILNNFINWVYFNFSAEFLL